MKYPLGIQHFETIRTDGYVYVDKTALIYKMVSEGQYYFLSRPRRFGKSLLVSTLEAFFKGKKELFEGLAISQFEKTWRVHPVLHLDLNAERYDTSEALKNTLGSSLYRWEQIYGKSEGEVTLSERFKGIIYRAYKQTGQKVVILVDEYDKPLLQAIGNPDLQEDYRATLRAFYAVEKSMGAYIQLAFFTGVTKFSKVSVFSDLNNLTDISLDARYAEICGITEKEIHSQLDAEVGRLAEVNGITKEACYERLGKNYDGYHFHVKSQGVYNPYSLLNTLSAQEFRDYWFETGTPTYLAEVLKKNNYQLENLTHEEISASLLGDIETADTNPLPLLYQSGYLTLKGYDERFGIYKLGFPNEEVERGFTNFLIPYYTPLRQEKSGTFLRQFITFVEQGQPESFMQSLDTLFAGGDYQIVGDAELYFQNAVFIIFRLMGFYTDVEHHTTDGRMDMVVKTQKYIYIFEFKLDKSSDEALRQIEAKQYDKPFEHDVRHIYRIGVNFSSKTRRIDSWKIV